MSTKSKSKKRIYISISPEVERSLDLLSAQKNIPVATAASGLLEQALEIEEDKIWDQIALERKKNNNKKYSHKEAWAQ